MSCPNFSLLSSCLSSCVKHQSSTALLDVFEAYQGDITETGQSEDDDDVADRVADTVTQAMAMEDQAYAVKYLTSPKLFHLQLADPMFRRQVRLSFCGSSLSVPSLSLFSVSLLLCLLTSSLMIAVGSDSACDSSSISAVRQQLEKVLSLSFNFSRFLFFFFFSSRDMLTWQLQNPASHRDASGMVQDCGLKGHQGSHLSLYAHTSHFL